MGCHGTRAHPEGAHRPLRRARHARGPDELIVEEPLEIRLDDELVATTMRTPGPRLRAGRRVLLHRRAARRARRCSACRYCAHRIGGRHRVQRGLGRHRRPGARARRPGWPRPRRRAGCAGRTSIDELAGTARAAAAVDARSPLDVLAAVPERVRARPGPVRRDRSGARGRRVRPDRASRSSCARTSVATTRSTRSSAGCCSTAACRRTELGLFVSGRAVVRDRAEGVGGRLRGGRRGERAVGAGGRHRPTRRGHHARRVRRDERSRSTSYRASGRTAHDESRTRQLGHPSSGSASRPTASASRSRTTTARWPRWRGPTGRTRSTRGTCSPRACATAAPSASPGSTTGRSTACTCAPPGCGCSRSTPPTPFDPIVLGRRRAAPSSSRRPSCAALGRLGHPMRRRRGEPGFHPISWDEALDAPSADAHRARPARDRTALYLTSRGITNEVYYVGRQGGAGHGHRQRRLGRPGLPRAVDARAEADDRRGRHAPARCRT